MLRINSVFVRLILIFTAVWLPIAVLEAQNLHQGLQLGYYGDAGMNMTLDFENLNPQLGVSFGFHGGYSYQFDSGNAEDARRIFINDATGGTIEKHGQAVRIGADIRIQLLQQNDIELRLYGGPRGSFYKGHYAFIGDNEEFDISSNQAGLELGFQGVLPVHERLDLTLSAGLSYFFPATLQGHGKYLYSPDGVDDNPRNDFAWEDADGAVDQPSLEIPVLLGIRWKLR